MIRKQLDSISVNSYSGTNSELIVPSRVQTSYAKQETYELSYSNFMVTTELPKAYTNDLYVGGTYPVTLEDNSYSYTAYMNIVSWCNTRNGVKLTMQYNYGLEVEEGDEPEPDPEPTIGDLGFTIDSTNYDKGGSSFTDNGDNTWTVDLLRIYPHGDYNLPFSDADGNIIFDAANMLNNNQGDPIFDIIIDEPNEYNASATFHTAPSYGSDDQMMGGMTAAIGKYELTGKIRTNVSNATVYLTDAEYNAITNAGQYYTYDGSQYDEENDGVVYKRYTLDLTSWQNAEGNAVITLEVFDPNSLVT